MNSGRDSSGCTSSSSNVLAKETVFDLIGKLSIDTEDIIKCLLLTTNAVSGALPITEFQDVLSNSSNLASNSKEFWTEILVVIQRYDLLTLIGSSKKDALEQVEARTYFPIVRRLLVKIYEEIPESKEDEFCMQEWQALGLQVHTLNEVQSGGARLAQILLMYEKTLGPTALDRLGSILQGLKLHQAFNEVKRFCEANKIDSNIQYYPMNQNPCGKCLIINNKNVRGEMQRLGSEVDRDALQTTFRNLGFLVQCYEDKTQCEMKDILKNVANEDHTEFCAFICCIMSHGESGVILGSDSVPLPTHEIRMTFCKCKSLVGKPKLFFFQACRGNNFQRSSAVGYQMDGPNGNPIERIEASQADCLIGHSTVDGNSAFRHSEGGSLFIKALVDVLQTILELSKVQLKVTNIVSSVKLPFAGETVSQTPEWTNTLRREIVFRRTNT